MTRNGFFFSTLFSSLWNRLVSNSTSVTGLLWKLTDIITSQLTPRGQVCFPLPTSTPPHHPDSVQDKEAAPSAGRAPQPYVTVPVLTAPGSHLLALQSPVATLHITPPWVLHSPPYSAHTSEKYFFGYTPWQAWLYTTAYTRTLVPLPGIEPVPPCIGRQSFNHQTTREVLLSTNSPAL